MRSWQHFQAWSAVLRLEKAEGASMCKRGKQQNSKNDGVPARFWMCVATATCRTRSLQKRSANTRVFIDLRHQEFSASFATRIIVTHHTETFAHICSSFRPNITRNLPKFSLFRRVFFSAPGYFAVLQPAVLVPKLELLFASLSGMSSAAHD